MLCATLPTGPGSLSSPQVALQALCRATAPVGPFREPSTQQQVQQFIDLEAKWTCNYLRLVESR